MRAAARVDGTWRTVKKVRLSTTSTLRAAATRRRRASDRTYRVYRPARRRTYAAGRLVEVPHHASGERRYRTSLGHARGRAEAASDGAAGAGVTAVLRCDRPLVAVAGRAPRRRRVRRRGRRCRARARGRSRRSRTARRSVPRRACRGPRPRRSTSHRVAASGSSRRRAAALRLDGRRAASSDGGDQVVRFQQVADGVPVYAGRGRRPGRRRTARCCRSPARPPRTAARALVRRRVRRRGRTTAQRARVARGTRPAARRRRARRRAARPRTSTTRCCVDEPGHRRAAGVAGRRHRPARAAASVVEVLVDAATRSGRSR